MAALVQTIPQQASTITLLQPLTAPSPASQQQQSSALQNHSHSLQMARNNQQPQRQTYTGGSSPITTGYRHSASSSTNAAQPVAPYAFTSTPGLASTGTSNSQLRPNTLSQLKSESWAPHSSQTDLSFPGVIPPRTHYHHAAGSVSTNSSASITSSTNSSRSKDDSAIVTRRVKPERAPRPLSTIDLSLPPITLTAPPAPSSPSMKPSPDRYRRGQRRADPPNITLPPASIPVAAAATSPSSAASDGTVLGEKYPALAFSNPENLELKTSFAQHGRNVSADNSSTAEKSAPELAKRYRRRSLGSIDAAGLNNGTNNNTGNSPAPEFLPKSKSPLAAAEQSAKSQVDTSQKPSSVNTSGRESPVPSTGSSKSQPATSKQDSKPATNTSRSTDVITRASSPLSKPVTMDAPTTEVKSQPKTKAQPADEPKVQSAAAKRLTEISKKGAKSGKSRLRRALSFSSVAELRNASEAPEKPEMTRKQQLDEELGAEQAAIAEKQEAAGLGENIYSGQRHFFTGSTDNISISSTASSASIMLRKMGNGVKRSTRSLVGLFRPKSLYNAPIEPSRVEPMVPQVSRVTVEAQREVQPPVTSNTQGGIRTVGRVSEDSNTSDDLMRARKSILGGDKERAEILAAVKKGILKKTMPGGSSPVMRPSQANFTESPRSSVPSTPREERPPGSGHRGSESVTIDGEDYFLPSGRFNSSRANSAPVTPQPSAKNISFSPRIQFHDTWPSGEYDRRGDVATCNRLTPLLAQQIKEELNTFKMEMEVHESSKVYTHFF